MNFIIIIIIIILVAIIFFMYKKIDSYKNEHFDAISDQVTNAVNNLYRTDLNSMRTLAQVSSNIITTLDNLTFPTNNITFNDITSNGNIIANNNIKILGDLEVDGNVNFKNKNTNLMEIYPKYMIMYFKGGEIIPLGWAPCDGKKYSINKNITTSNPNNYIEDNINGTLTPDLSQIETISLNPLIKTPPLIMKIT